MITPSRQLPPPPGGDSGGPITVPFRPPTEAEIRKIVAEELKKQATEAKAKTQREKDEASLEEAVATADHTASMRTAWAVCFWAFLAAAVIVAIVGLCMLKFGYILYTALLGGVARLFYAWNKRADRAWSTLTGDVNARHEKLHGGHGHGGGDHKPHK